MSLLTFWFLFVVSDYTARRVANKPDEFQVTGLELYHKMRKIFDLTLETWQLPTITSYTYKVIMLWITTKLAEVPT